MSIRLFHFSEDPDINVFQPRSVRTPAERPPGMEWLNGPLVWAIEEDHQKLYLFPRECPRIVMWATAETTDADRQRWLGDSTCPPVAYIERSWQARFEVATLARYELPSESFRDIDDVGMWVSDAPVCPRSKVLIDGLAARLRECGTALRVVDSLVPMREVWRSSVHASGIRLRNAAGWGKPTWSHSKPGRTVRF